MQKTRTIKPVYLVITGLLFVVLIIIRHYAPKPIDWKMTFSYDMKTPYGCYVLGEMYKPLFGNNITDNYESLYRNPLTENVEGKNLIIVTGGFLPDEAETRSLLEFVENGNDAFVSAVTMGKELLDTLGLEMKTWFFDSAFFRSSRERINFYNPVLKRDSGYVFRRMVRKGYFMTGDKFTGRLLGYDHSGHVNFVDIPWGEGHLFLHSQPLVFTNLEILYGNHEYAANALSYLPKRTLIVDKYYKPFRAVNNSPVKFILSQSSLRSAYYLLLLALIIYLAIGGKRKQRVIPVIEPLRNTSAEFIRTVGRLYFKTGNHANIAQKKTIYFREFLRERYFIKNISEEEKDISIISEKTGVDASLVKKLVKEMAYFEKQQKITESALMAYHKDIEEFYRTCL